MFIKYFLIFWSFSNAFILEDRSLVYASIQICSSRSFDALTYPRYGFDSCRFVCMCAHSSEQVIRKHACYLAFNQTLVETRSAVHNLVFLFLFCRKVENTFQDVVNANQVNSFTINSSKIEHLYLIFYFRKPLTHKGKKILMAREAQIKEAAKNTLFLEGRKCSGDIKKALKDLYHFKKPLCKVLSRSNDITPFDDPSSLQL